MVDQDQAPEEVQVARKQQTRKGKQVKVKHKKTKAFAYVTPGSLKVWEKRGWTAVEDKK